MKQSNDKDDSSEIIFNEMIRLYNLESQSHDALNNKAYGLIVSNGTIITLITLVTVQIIDRVMIQNCGIFLVLIPYLFLIYSMLISIKSYKVDNLSTLDAEKLLYSYYGKPASDLIDQLSSNIADDIKSNQRKSEKKSDRINCSMNLLMIGTITFVIVFFILIFF